MKDIFRGRWSKATDAYRTRGLFAFMLFAVYGVAFAFSLVQSNIPGHVTILSAILAAGLLAASLIDQCTQRLPNALTFLIASLGLAATWWFEMDSLGARTFAMFSGFCGLGAVIMTYRAIQGRDGMGWGDAKLYGAAGAWVGLPGLLTLLLWSCLTALAFALVLYATRVSVGSHTRIPFGPHLAFGTWLVWLFGPLI